MNLFKRNNEKKVALSELIGTSVRVLNEKEMEQIYGGCNVEYSPIASISKNIIINEYVSRR